MKILAFDTCNNLASVALISGGKFITYNSTSSSSEQAEKLFALIDQTLKQANLNLNEIDLIVVTNGPGSFTGVRIGLSAALGMEIATKAKIIALNNFQVIAWHAKQEHPGKNITVLLDARNGQLYSQKFNQNLEEISVAKLVNIEELNEVHENDMVLAGDGVRFLQKYNQELAITNNAKLIATASEFFYLEKKYQPLEPLYIRAAYVS